MPSEADAVGLASQEAISDQVTAEASQGATPVPILPVADPTTSDGGLADEVSQNLDGVGN